MLKLFDASCFGDALIFVPDNENYEDS